MILADRIGVGGPGDWKTAFTQLDVDRFWCWWSRCAVRAGRHRRPGLQQGQWRIRALNSWRIGGVDRGGQGDHRRPSASRGGAAGGGRGGCYIRRRAFLPLPAMDRSGRSGCCRGAPCTILRTFRLGEEGGLVESGEFSPTACTFPNGTHISRGWRSIRIRARLEIVRYSAVEEFPRPRPQSSAGRRADARRRGTGYRGR